MSLNGPLSVPLGESKNEHFLQRLSKQSQQQLADAANFKGFGRSAATSGSFSRPARPLSITVNHPFVPTSDKTTGRLKLADVGFNGNKARFCRDLGDASPSVALNDAVLASSLSPPLQPHNHVRPAPRLPPKPIKLLKDPRIKSSVESPPEMPRRPDTSRSLVSDANSAEFYGEKHHLNIQIELPTYLARPDSSEIAKLPERPSYGRRVAESLTTPQTLPPKPAKPALILSSVFSSSSAAFDAIVSPKSAKPPGLTPRTKTASSVLPRAATKDSPSRLPEYNDPAPPTLVPAKPPMKPAIAPKPVLPRKPGSAQGALQTLAEPIQQKQKALTHAIGVFPPSRTQLHPKPGPPKPKKLSLATKHLAPQNPAPATSTVLQTRRKASDNEPAVELRVVLSSVIRAHGMPDMSARSGHRPITEAQTHCGDSRENSKTEKLTHPNKGRSKGPKRRLPTDKKAGNGTACAETAPRRILEKKIPLLLATSQSTPLAPPLSPLSSPDTNVGPETRPSTRKFKPPKAKKNQTSRHFIPRYPAKLPLSPETLMGATELVCSLGP